MTKQQHDDLLALLKGAEVKFDIQRIYGNQYKGGKEPLAMRVKLKGSYLVDTREEVPTPKQPGRVKK
jgi:hypothetical protein